MDYIELLQKYNLKVTPQRLAIVELLNENTHMSVEGLYSSLQDMFPSISLATIYKNIHAMNNKSLLLEVKIADKKSVYELDKKEHYHAVCTKCNKIMDIYLDTSSLYAKAKAITNYDLKESSIVFNGTCEECSA